MFEKEADEYADNQIGCGDGYYEWTDVTQAYQKGAEFGYYKAKEELEKDNNRLFLEGAKRVEELEAQIEKMKCCHNYGYRIGVKENCPFLIEHSSDKRLEPILQKLKDLGVIKSWYYNGTYHAQ